MRTIRFTMRGIEGEYPAYSVSYEPVSKGGYGGRATLHPGEGLGNLVTESLWIIQEDNTDKQPVHIELKGDFPEIERKRISTAFDLYARAEQVRVSYSEER